MGPGPVFVCGLDSCQPPWPQVQTNRLSAIEWPPAKQLFPWSKPVWHKQQSSLPRISGEGHPENEALLDILKNKQINENLN